MGYIGFRLGLSAELAKLIGVTGGFFVSFRYYQPVGDLLAQKTFLLAEWAAALSMVGLTAAVYLGLVLAIRLLGKLASVTFQPKLNKAGGLVIGLARALLICSLALVVCRQLPSAYLQASIDERSMSGRPLSRVAPAVYDTLFPMAGRFLTSCRSQAR